MFFYDVHFQRYAARQVQFLYLMLTRAARSFLCTLFFLCIGQRRMVDAGAVQRRSP